MKILFRIIDAAVLAFLSNSLILFAGSPLYILYVPLFILYLLVNVFPSPYNLRIKSIKLRICAEGSDLLASFLIAATASVIFHIITAFILIPGNWILWTLSALAALLILSLTFWNGIIRVYCTSVQLGIKLRVIGALCGWIPFVNIWALFMIITVVSKEVTFENKKTLKNEQRKAECICKTKYPLLLVHGVFFRDFKYINYWGRIPSELEKNGAQIFYGNHQSALSVKDSGAELTERIKEIVGQLGCEKVNIIAHSKGGLDCRYAISYCGADKYVASLTTINTPHRGCMFVDYLLNKVPIKVQNGIASGYNSALRKLGDKNPDFMAAVNDLTYEKCAEFNSKTPDKNGILYQSVGSKLNRAVNGKFPLNFSYHLVRHFGGANDGLVAENSFAWGSSYTFLTVNGKRGISHGDIIDLNRENIPDFDVREFYVQTVSDLKNKGY